MNTSTFTFELPIDQEDIAVRLSPYSERGNLFLPACISTERIGTH